MTKKALITGVTGMVGSHLTDFLLEHTDWDVYGVCRWRSPLDNVSHLLDRVNRKDRVFFEYADLNDEMSLISVPLFSNVNGTSRRSDNAFFTASCFSTGT